MKKDVRSKLDFIFGRRSIRVFLPAEITDEDVKTLLSAAMAAPSAVAKDPWRFVVMRNKETLRKIADVLPNGKMLADASVGIAVCGDIEAAHDHQLSYLLQDCSAAIENLLLAAHILGFGACWLGVHPRENRVAAIKEILNLPQNIIPVSVIAIGKPGEAKEPRTRYSDDKVRYEKWQ
ncbi:MAG: nitroreductase family protein [Verrucomicrobiae bacterium]|nr:nitroreductase family protein [Verrucomicrobiae bacterium]